MKFQYITQKIPINIQKSTPSEVPFSLLQQPPGLRPCWVKFHITPGLSSSVIPSSPDWPENRPDSPTSTKEPYLRLGDPLVEAARAPSPQEGKHGPRRLPATGSGDSPGCQLPLCGDCQSGVWKVEGASALPGLVRGRPALPGRARRRLERGRKGGPGGKWELP